MALAIISEHSRIQDMPQGEGQVAVFDDDITKNNVTFTTATQSSAFQNGTRVLRIIADADCHYKVGADPTAEATDTKLPAEVVEYIGVNQGDKISIYDGSS